MTTNFLIGVVATFAGFGIGVFCVLITMAVMA